MAADQIVDGGAAAAVGHVHDVDAGLLAQQLAGEMMRRPGAGRAVLQPARVGLGVGDQLGHRLHRQVGVDREADDVGAGIGDRRKVLHRIERRFL